MSTFALDVNSAPGDIITGLNYALSNLGQGGSISSAGNVLVANITTGEITTTTSTGNTTIVSYLYQYMDVKYANSSTGGSGFSGNSQYKSYYGLRNTANTTISSNPADYVWFQVTGGFGASKSLWYQTIGGRQVAFFPNITAPASDFISVPDDTPLNLDTITAAQNNQVINVSAYYQANVTPATPAGGTYDFTTFTLTPPAGWSATIPGFLANTDVYISQAAFVGNTASTSVGPSTLWTTPVVFSSQFNGNTGPAGARGFVPLGFVVAPSDPTGASDATLTSWFSASRSNASAPIGLGYAPIAGDTAQFFYQDLFNPNDDVTLVKSFDGTNWSTVTAEVVSGGLIVPGTITANTLNANQVYAVTVQSTNATLGDNNSDGYWFQANTGNGRFGGNLNIGNNLTIGANAQVGSNLTVGTNAVIGNNLSVGASAVIGTNLTVGANANVGSNLTVSTNAVIGANASIGADLIVGTNASIGSNLTVGENASIGNNLIIGANLNVTGLITQGNLGDGVVTNSSLQNGSITGVKIANGTITGNLIQANTITGNLIVANTITGNLIAANTITGNLIQADTITGNNIAAGTITADKLAVGALTVGNIISVGATFNSNTSSGYWLNNVSGAVRFGGTTSIGNNLTVGNNAIIGSDLIVGNNAIVGGNISLGGLVYAGNLLANVVATTNVQADAITQSVYVADDPAVNLISWTNGNTQISSNPGYLWPLNTRGFGVGGGATIIPSLSGIGTVGTAFGGRIQVQFQAYVNSLTNAEYNLIELWKSGGSNFYKYGFKKVKPAFNWCTVTNTWGSSAGFANAETFSAVGINGATFGLNFPTPTSGQYTTTPPARANVWQDYTSNANNYWTTSPYYIGGLFGQGIYYRYDWSFNRFGPGNSNSNYYPQFNVFGSAGVYATVGDNTGGYSPNAYNWAGSLPQVLVGAGGNIARNYAGVGDASLGSILTLETSGVFNDLYDVAFDRSPLSRNPNSIVTIAVGTGGTILKDTRTYTTPDYYSTFVSSLASHSGWSQVSSPTSQNLNAVGNNGITTPGTIATLWCIVGNNGTILTSANGSTWSLRTSGTTANLNGVAVSGTNIIVVGDGGLVLKSTDSGATWTSYSNPAATAGRNLYSVCYSYYGSKIVAVGDEIIMTSTNGGTVWTNSTQATGYQGSSSVNSSLTRLLYYGSWPSVANVSLPPIQQRVSNAQVISGTYTDIYYNAGSPVTYYLVLGNMVANTQVYTGGPSLGVIEFKR